MVRVIQFGVAGAVVALMLVGCAGGSEDTTSPTLSKKEFVRKANARCEKVGKEVLVEVRAITTSTKQRRTAETEKLLAEAALPIYREMIQDVKTLGNPAGEKEQAESIYDAFEKQLDAVEEKPGLLSNGTETFNKPNQLARKFGINMCQL